MEDWQTPLEKLTKAMDLVDDVLNNHKDFYENWFNKEDPEEVNIDIKKNLSDIYWTLNGIIYY